MGPKNLRSCQKMSDPDDFCREIVGFLKIDENRPKIGRKSSESSKSAKIDPPCWGRGIILTSQMVILGCHFHGSDTSEQPEFYTPQNRQKSGRRRAKSWHDFDPPGGRKSTIFDPKIDNFRPPASKLTFPAPELARPARHHQNLTLVDTKQKNG